MSKTSAELVVRALEVLCEVGSGQSPEAEERRRVSLLVTPTLAMLRRRGLADIPTPTADDQAIVDDELFLPVANILAWQAGTNLPSDEKTALAAISQDAEEKLREMAFEGEVATPVRACYF